MFNHIHNNNKATKNESDWSVENYEWQCLLDPLRRPSNYQSAGGLAARLVIPMQSQADALSGQYHAHQMHSQASATPNKLPVEHMTSAWFKSPSRDL